MALLNELRGCTVVKVISAPEEDSTIGSNTIIHDSVGSEGIVLQVHDNVVAVYFADQDDYWNFYAENLEVVKDGVQEGEPAIGSNVVIVSTPPADVVIGVTDEMIAAVGGTHKVVSVHGTPSGDFAYLVEVSADRPYFFRQENLKLA